MKQLSLFDFETPVSAWKVDCFSANDFGNQSARQKLEEKYASLTEITESFNRQSVSYQLSKKDRLHKWLKYKEGFSADLVQKLIDEFGTKQDGCIMDPFLGSGTTSIVCKMNGINSIGFDILPMTKIAVDAKQNIFEYDIAEIKGIIKDIENAEIPSNYNKSFAYISITEGAFPPETEKEIAFYQDWLQNSVYSAIAKNLVNLCIINSLEQISYTAKDGQYLRWDYRSKKMIEAKEYREANNKKPFVVRLDKGELPTLKETLIKELNGVLSDIITLQTHYQSNTAHIDFFEGSVLYELPKMGDEIIDGVITSPPYCNRYDYTRTYALELNYLGYSREDICGLRQSLLSCTVENKSKLDSLHQHYTNIGQSSRYHHIANIIDNNDALKEILSNLHERDANGDINNKGVIRMVEGYFTELTFLYAELYRLCKKGAKVAFVNDNVRYGGEVIPVDYLSTELAEQIGFKPLKIYTLKQQKGNSSQQMKKFGRVALRKSITIWEK